VLACLIGCLPTRPFPCDSDADCAGLDRGRCELADGVCSEFDAACASLHRYAEHAGDKAGTCTPDTEVRRLLRNACVAGEIYPTLHDPCGALVCEKLPACCTTTWNEACVAIAAQRCEVDCAARIATASASRTELLVRDGAGYRSVTDVQTAAGRVAWLDAQQTRPRLALGRTTGLQIFAPMGPDPAPTYGIAGMFNNGTGSSIQAITAADVNGDDRVDIGLAFTEAAPYIVVLDGDIQVPVLDADKPSQTIAWADYTGDRVPDFAVGTSTDYRVFEWTGSEYRRSWRNEETIGSFSSMGWGDIDGDGILDLAAIGKALAVHIGTGEDLFQPSTAIVRVFSTNDAVGVVGDLDGDFRADVIAFPKAGDGGDTLSVFSGWNGAFPPPYQRPSPRMSHVALADIDGDRDLDVIGAVEGGGLVWFRNASVIGSVVLDDPAPIAAGATATWFAVTGW
jgi:hypothetical protein